MFDDSSLSFSAAAAASLSSSSSSSLSWHSSSVSSAVRPALVEAAELSETPESSEASDGGSLYDRLRLEFLTSVSGAREARRTRDSVFDDRLLTRPALHWALTHVAADLLLVRARDAMEHGQWGEASALLAPLVVSRAVEDNRTFSNEVFATANALLHRTWPGAQPRGVERFAQLYWAYTSNNSALLSLVCHKMALRCYKDAFILMQECLFDEQLMRTTLHLLAALLCHRAWCDERRPGPFTQREFDLALAVPTNTRIDADSPPHELLGVALHLLQALARGVERQQQQQQPQQPQQQQQEQQEQQQQEQQQQADTLPADDFLSCVFTPTPNERERIAATWEPVERVRELRHGKPLPTDEEIHEPVFDRFGKIVMRRRKRGRPRTVVAKTRAIMLHRNTNYAEPPMLELEAAAVERLSEIYESFEQLVKAEALLRDLFASKPDDAHVVGLLFSFWRRRPSGRDAALQRAALRLLELDPAHVDAFVFVRARCGDPGPNLLGSRHDVLRLALRRVAALADDAPTWLWLVRLTLHWRRDIASLRHAEIEAAQREFSVFWHEHRELVGNALLMPPRQRSLSVTDRDYYALLYALVFAEEIAPVVLHAARFAANAYAILHPLDTDVALRALVTGRVRATALQSPPP